jgi:hypothetical protein
MPMPARARRRVDPSSSRGTRAAGVSTERLHHAWASLKISRSQDLNPKTGVTIERLSRRVKSLSSRTRARRSRNDGTPCAGARAPHDQGATSVTPQCLQKGTRTVSVCPKVCPLTRCMNTSTCIRYAVMWPRDKQRRKGLTNDNTVVRGKRDWPSVLDQF